MILLLQYTLIFASVLILVALGGCFAEHSGVINLGLEGIMIMGALGGALTMRYVPNTAPAIVMLLAVIVVSALVGMVYSCLLAVASINFKADQTLVGTALNLLGTAGATVIVKAINTAANPDDVSSIVQYAGAKKAFTVNLGSFEFSWFMLVTALLLAALYHDVGKCYQQTEILSKPGRLTDSEYAAMKRHPIDSFNLLSARFSPDVARIARGHHERLDGSGYPDGLTADQMSLEIRILSAVDTFDAMTSDRPYKKGMSTRSAIAELTTLSHQYDAEVVALLKAIVEDGTADQICRLGVEEKR